MFTFYFIIERLFLSIFAFDHRHAAHSIVLSIILFHFVRHVLILSKCLMGSSLVLFLRYSNDFFVILQKKICCNPSLGSWPRQGLARVRAKREARESHLMLPGMQELESRWTPKSSKINCRGQNPMNWRILYIIKKIFERRCLKWDHITHLGTSNTSYGQKKGRESNWQFDSQPLKVSNHPDFLACKWHVTYCWKVIDKGYNFCFKPHFNRRSEVKVMHPQSHRSPRC